MTTPPQTERHPRGSSWRRLVVGGLAAMPLLQVGGCGPDTLIDAVLAELSRLSGSFVFFSVQTIAENLLDA